ncbi:MAG: hypothetical protein ABH851_01120 [Methanobacteriota archaeon]
MSKLRGIPTQTPPTNVDAWVGAAALDGRLYCMECGFEGIPLIFSDYNGYGKFRKLRKQELTQNLDSSIPTARSSDKKPSQKRPGFSVILSLFIPGLGHYYAGEKMRALLAFSIYIFIYAASTRFVSGSGPINLIIPLTYLGIAYDSYRVTTAIKKSDI